LLKQDNLTSLSDELREILGGLRRASGYFNVFLVTWVKDMWQYLMLLLVSLVWVKVHTSFWPLKIKDNSTIDKYEKYVTIAVIVW
jgi:hypothetical protein